MSSNNSKRRRHPTLVEKFKTYYKPLEPEKTTNIEKKKLELMEKIQKAIEPISHVKNMGLCFCEDPVIIYLQAIEDEAKQCDLVQIAKMANLAIGKRILNIQLQRKRTEIENKIEKKRQIQDHFRENRVKKTNYEEIALEKLNENSYIAKPYSDGKAFIESTIFYDKVIHFITKKSYDEDLEQCNYLEVIKNVNKLFFNKFSNTSSEESRKQASNSPFLKVGLFLLFIIVGLCIALIQTGDSLYSYIIFGINSILLIVLAIVSFYNYFNIKNTKNQLQETVMEVNQYFKYLNKKNKQQGKRFEWYCPEHFLYLEVKFLDKDSSSIKCSEDNLNQ